MTCRICNSEEHFAAKCPQGQGGGRGSGSSGMPSATFHVPEGRQVVGRRALTWSGLGTDEDVEGPLARLFRELGTTPEDQSYMVTQGEGPLMASDPWARGRLEPGPSRHRDGSGSASSMSSWIPRRIPRQMAPQISLGASTVTTWGRHPPHLHRCRRPGQCNKQNQEREKRFRRYCAQQ